MEAIIAFIIQIAGDFVGQLVKAVSLMQKAPTLTDAEITAEIARIRRAESKLADKLWADLTKEGD